MKEIKKALWFGLTIGITLNLSGFMVNYFLESLEVAIKNFKFIGLITLSLFTAPCVFSAYYYNKYLIKVSRKNISISLRSSCIWSFITQFTITLSYLSLFTEETHRFVVAIFTGAIAIIVALGGFFIYYLIKNKPKETPNNRTFTYSKKNIFLIAIILSTALTLIMLATGSNIFRSISSFFILFIKSIIASFLISELFQHIYTTKKGNIKKALIILTYTSVIVVFSTNYNQLSFYKDPNYLRHTVFFMLTLRGPYFFVLCLMIHSYFIFNINKMDKEYLNQLSLNTSLKYNQLKSQISPHFLFNNLSVLTGLIEESPKKAVLFSEDLAYIYRHFLEQEQKDLVKLSDALKFAKTYLNLLEHRFENAIEISFSEIKNESLYLIPLALQQVLENIVKHNEISLQHKVKISLTLNDDYLIISNTKNPKLNRTHSTKTGLLNIKERYAYFTETKVNTEETNTSFTIMLPLLTIEA